MRLVLTKPFKATYRKKPAREQDAIDEALKRLSNNPQHPSLFCKRIKGTEALGSSLKPRQSPFLGVGRGQFHRDVHELQPRLDP